MTTPSQGPSGFDNPQANLGDADAVPKTTYVTGEGTRPERRATPRGKGETAVAAAAAGGLTPGAIGAIAVAVLLVLFLAFYLF
jgi:hypothetical protein